MKSIIAFSLIFIQSLINTSEAARYVVTYPSSQSFRSAEVKVALMNSNSTYASSHGLKGSPALAPIEIEHTLPNVKALVIDVDSHEKAVQLAQGTGAAMVEKEIIYPKPSPIRGYRLTSEQSGNLSSATENFAPMNELELGPATPWGVKTVKAQQAWGDSQAGKGVRVLVLDTGIDRDHPAIKPNFEKGADFVWDSNKPYPYADKDGHGTHVAGTILGAWLPGGFVGVAPKASLLSGRVCSSDGCSNISVILGIEWGIREKVDIISMSLGGPQGSAAEKKAVEAAAQAGVTVVAASGNDGKPEVSFPAAFDASIAVGAINSDLKKADFSNWGPELDVVAPGVDVKSSVPMGTGLDSEVQVEVDGQKKSILGDVPRGAPVIEREVNLQVVAAGYGKPEEFTKDVVGKLALIKRGEKITFSDKVKNAIAAGAAGVVIYNNEPGRLRGVVSTDGSTVPTPVMMIEESEGVVMVTQLSQGKAVSINMKSIKSDYSELSGTSMATPHVSGVVALMKGANKKLTPAQVADILKATSVPLTPNGSNEYGKGLVNAEAAVQLAIKTN